MRQFQALQQRPLQRQYQRRSDIRGNREMVLGNFKGVVPLVNVYVGGCSLETTPADVKAYCENDLKVDVKECVDLISKSEYTKSFRVMVDAVSREKVLKSDMWPCNVVIRKFYTPRSRKENTNVQNAY